MKVLACPCALLLIPACFKPREAVHSLVYFSPPPAVFAEPRLPPQFSVSDDAIVTCRMAWVNDTMLVTATIEVIRDSAVLYRDCGSFQVAEDGDQLVLYVGRGPEVGIRTNAEACGSDEAPLYPGQTLVVSAETATLRSLLAKYGSVRVRCGWVERLRREVFISPALSLKYVEH